MEQFRQWIRGFLGYDSQIYRAASRVTSSLAIFASEGGATLRRLRSLERGASRPAQIEALSLRLLSHPFWVRAGTADIVTVVNNLIREEYGQLPAQLHPRWMIDAGAYIGDTAAYFLSRYPGLRVISLEPEPANLELARRNLEPYGERSLLYAAGLWGRDEVIQIGGSFTSAKVGEDGLRIRGISVPTLLDRHGIDYLDILKMDIEGAEREIFGVAPECWLDKVGCLIIEFHGEDLERSALAVLSAAGFNARRFRSLVFFSRG